MWTFDSNFYHLLVISVYKTIIIYKTILYYDSKNVKKNYNNRKFRSSGLINTLISYLTQYIDINRAFRLISRIAEFHALLLCECTTLGCSVHAVILHHCYHGFPILWIWQPPGLPFLA